LSTEAELVVTGRHYYNCPYLVAFTWHDRRPLVDMLLREPGHTETVFHVGARPAYDRTDGYPTRWLRVGYNNGLGAALFFDDPYLNHKPRPAVTDDWAWVALNPEPLAEPPTIYYDQPTPTVFPPQSIMPLELLRAVILEWADTGERPTSVEWLTVNLLSWDLTDTGEMMAPRRKNTRHTKRLVGWGNQQAADT